MIANCSYFRSINKSRNHGCTANLHPALPKNADNALIFHADMNI